MGFLTIAISLLFVQYWFRDLIGAWKKAGELDTFLASEKFYETLWFAILVILPLLYVNFSTFGRSLDTGRTGHQESPEDKNQALVLKDIQPCQVLVPHQGNCKRQQHAYYI